jgi:NAD(P)-dependent dehydrogenase (short-subunit alcohol dehydrogenase family)
MTPTAGDRKPADVRTLGPGGDDGARVAIVTGAGRGLGRAMALALARSGVRVVATASRERAEVEAVARAAGGDCILPMLADVTREADAERVIQTAREHFGRLDIVVNNAGRGMKYVSERFMSEPTHFWEVEPDVWRMVIDTNINGPFLMARAATPHLVRAGWGRIINISMNHSTMRRAGFSPYGPSKAALESETVIWAQDLRGSGVTVNALLPGGATLTGMIPAAAPRTIRERLLDPALMGPPLVWLVSRAADTLTGRRLNACRWDANDPLAAIEEAGWTGETAGG